MPWELPAIAALNGARDHQLSSLPVRLEAESREVLQAAGEGRFVSPELYRLQLAAERLSLIGGFEELVALQELPFQPFDYQIAATRTALQRFRGRGLLCDEVGLGKTIEAGLALREYRERGMAQRVLILCPPGLVEQWQEELSSKFGMADFATTSDPDFRAHQDAWERHPRVIASLATARRQPHRAAILRLRYDLVIVDEAHHLHNRRSVSWRFLNGVHAKYLLFLTATPVQNDLSELYNLVTLLKPGQLRTPREFQRRFVVRGDPRLPKNRGLLRELLGDVMVRHTRGTVGLRLPPRRARTIRVEPSPEERALYHDVSELVRRGLTGPTASPQRRFVLQVLQREIGSSPYAAAPTLLALAEGTLAAEAEGLRALARRAGGVVRWTKGEALERLLGALSEEKVLIFTHFLPTLERLAERLRSLGVDFELYHGGLSTAQKQRAIRRFEEQAQILLSTEAAGEGRNLQFCRVMVNFDLPWNPMRIEQRVGRIHRIGQDRQVLIYNLSARGTLEDYLLDILQRKLNMFELVIGEMDMILGRLTEERDFEELLLETWVRAGEERELRDGMEALGEGLARAREAYESSRGYDEALFGDDFAA